MYLSTHKKKVKDKIYISYSLRTSYRDTKGKVKHKHIANLPKCTDEEIKALRLALTFKGKLEELGSIEDISVKQHVKLCIAKLKSSNKILKSNLLLDE